MKSKKKTDYHVLLHLSTFMKPYIGYMCLGVCMLILVLGVQLVRPVIMKEFIDVGIATKDMGLITNYAVIYIGVILFGMVALGIENYALQSFGQRIIYDIRNKIFSNILAMGPREFSSYPVGNLVTRVTNDTESIRTLYTEVLVKISSSIFQIIGILVFMFWIDTTLASIILLLMPVFTGIIFVYRKYARKAFRGVRSKVAASNTSVQEMLNAILMIKTYVGEVIMEKSYDRVSREFLQAGLFEVKTFAIFRPIVDGLFFVALIAIFTVTGYFDSITEAGTVFAFLQYINRIFEPIKEIAEKYGNLQSALAGAERIIPMLEEGKDSVEATISIPAEFDTIRSIEFDHVYFSYDGSDNYVLRDITWSLQEGEFLGIAGPSGGGKSTMMQLLLGFETPTKGTIRINGKDVQDMDLRVIRQSIGYVFQDSHLFKGSIKDNISLFDDAVSLEMVQAAAEKAYLHASVQRLEAGYETPVGYLGSLLSQGQRQLLSLARTLVQNKSLLVFDEATSNIDSHTEELLQQSIGNIKGEKTMIAIAHRLSTLRDATKIIVISEGAIVESGTLEEVLENKGLFYSLWNA
ncbi:ABC transporter ATP-binding protein [Veillonella sp. CHU740]|uniref:ABC transporter ATP-binding protein n=1 Tax=Veillonella sp. CHU740 TaxID=2490950 RepID=UPI000F8EF226|nr:ABC transporter ATP-binding protein [Veillonella sp. CHU740]